MQLTMFSDYALRLTLYLAANSDRPVPLEEASRAYGISKNHLVKVAGLLQELKVIESVRGRTGGVRLAMDPRDIRIGWLVRRTEPHMDLVECFEAGASACPITSACDLRGMLKAARDAFLESLDRHTLADLASRDERLIPLWRNALEAAEARA